MNVSRKLRVRDHESVRRLREFLWQWWTEAGLDAMLTPVEQPNGLGVATQVIEDVRRLAAANPFAPVVLTNAAAVGKFARDHPGGRLAALLGPCEPRALVELRKRRHGQAANENGVIVGVDCLATLPPDEFSARAGTQGIGSLTREALEYAAGDCSPRRPRTACRVCPWPAPRASDVLIGAIGVVPSEYLLVIARDERTAERLHLTAVTDDDASEYEVVRRELAVGSIAKKRERLPSEIVRSLPQRFSDVASLLVRRLLAVRRLPRRVSTLRRRVEWSTGHGLGPLRRPALAGRAGRRQPLAGLVLGLRHVRGGLLLRRPHHIAHRPARGPHAARASLHPRRPSAAIAQGHGVTGRPPRTADLGLR